jgi:hypothetical protein
VKKPQRIAIAAALTLSSLAVAASSAPAYTVLCNDGTYSDAGGKSGACSHHHGVAGGGAPSAGGSPSTGTTPTPAPTPTPAAPVDLLPPQITVAAPASAVVGAGRPFTPPAISISDDVAWPTGSYTVTVSWGDGSQEPVAFPGISVPSLPVSLPLPPHVYAHAGSFSITASITDPAGHAETVPVTSAAITPSLTAPAGYPRLTGTPRVGRTLTCRTGNWGDPDADVSIRWRANGKLIPAADGSAFRARPRDKGRRITCQVVVSNDAFRASATSNALRIAAAPRRHG